MTITNTPSPNLIDVLALPECFDKVFSVLDNRDLHQYSLVSKDAYSQREFFFRLRLQILKGTRDPSSSPYKVDRLFEKIEAHVYARFSPDIPSHYVLSWTLTHIFTSYRTTILASKYDSGQFSESDIQNLGMVLSRGQDAFNMPISTFEAINKEVHDYSLEQTWLILRRGLLRLLDINSLIDFVMSWADMSMIWPKLRELLVVMCNQFDSILPASDAQAETIRDFFRNQANISLFQNAFAELASTLPLRDASAAEVRTCLNHPSIKFSLKQIDTLDLSFLSLTTFPPELNELTNLRSLHLVGNNLIVPPELNELTNLKSLNLSLNRLMDIPDLHLQELSELGLSSMKITKIPSLDLPRLERFIFDGDASMFVSDEMFQKVPDLIYNFRRSEILTRCLDLFLAMQCSLEQWSSSDCHCESSLALLCQSMRRKNFSIEEVKHILFNGLIEKDRNLIYEMIWDLGGQVKNGDLKWGEHHAFDNGKLFRFALAVELAILKKLSNLSQEQKNRVYGEIYKLAGNPETTDDQWGERHALFSLARLADALARVEK